jgi:hypothetical protein
MLVGSILLQLNLTPTDIPHSSLHALGPRILSTQPDLKVYDLGHLGLVASVRGRIRLAETVDRLVGPRPGEKVSTG